MLSGCQGLNLSPQPGPHVQLDTLRPTADFYSRVDKPVQQSGSSLAGMSRENWNGTTFYVPIKGVEHKPIYTDNKPDITHSTARQRDEFPTQASVVQGTDAQSTLDQTSEALLGPVRAAWDILWMVPKMVATPPDRTVSSPRDGYERRPHATRREQRRSARKGPRRRPQPPLADLGPARNHSPPASPFRRPRPIPLKLTFLPPAPPLPPPAPRSHPCRPSSPLLPRARVFPRARSAARDARKNREQNKPKGKP